MTQQELRDEVSRFILFLSNLTDEEREQIWPDLLEGYCIFCGRKGPCYCMRDD